MRSADVPSFGALRHEVPGRDAAPVSSILLCGFAGTGTAQDLVPVAAVLLARGHRVTIVAGGAAEAAYADMHVTFVPVAEADLPISRVARPPFWQRVREVFDHVRIVYVEPAPQQWETVRRVIVEAAVDVVLTDGVFFGASFLAFLPRDERPSVVDLGTFPISIPDVAVPPYGFGVPPTDTLVRRLQTLGLGLAAARPYLQLTRAFTAMVEQLTGVRPRGDIRVAGNVADVWAQLTVTRFEYPRALTPPNVRFVGALRPPAYGHAPDWWNPADRRQVVAVLTDTGAAVEDLVLPTIRAFAGEDVVIVISGATRADVEERVELPIRATMHFEERMPWEYFARSSTVAVSTGDYVHTQYALRYGIPVVAAGTFGHQVETAARVDWAGVGIDLHTRRPEPATIRTAVDRIRTNTTVHSALARIAAQIASSDAEGTLADLVDELTATQHHQLEPAEPAFARPLNRELLQHGG